MTVDISYFEGRGTGWKRGWKQYESERMLPSEHGVVVVLTNTAVDTMCTRPAHTKAHEYVCVCVQMEGSEKMVLT